MTDDGYTRADAFARAQEAWRLRRQGLLWESIADRLGYANGQNVMRLVRDTFGELPQPEKDEYRRLVTERGEFLYGLALRTFMEATTPRDKAAALRVCVSANMAQARVTGVLLDRFYNPSQREIDGQVAAWLSEGYTVLDGELVPPSGDAQALGAGTAWPEEAQVVF